MMAPPMQKKDRTLSELDQAIAATQATGIKIDKLVQEKEMRDTAAQTTQDQADRSAELRL